jgi:hypothetical protein
VRCSAAAWHVTLESWPQTTPVLAPFACSCTCADLVDLPQHLCIFQLIPKLLLHLWALSNLGRGMRVCYALHTLSACTRCSCVLGVVCTVWGLLWG